MKPPWQKIAALKSPTAKRESQTVKMFRITAVLAACMLALHANAALFEDDEARRAILDLRQKVDVSQQRSTEELRKAHEDNAQLRRSLLDLSSQIETLRSEMASLRGQNEQLSRSMAEMQRSQKDLSQGVEDRLRKVEPGKVAVDGREFSAEPAEKQEFEAALATLRKGDFAVAQNNFLAFMKRYPQSGYKSSAWFWLANAQFALRDYRSAGANFRALVTADPDYLRAPEALLSLANCQVELKDVKAARKTLEDIVRNYPQSEAASAARERLVKLK
jgi:tol-pal system protein YbgF